MFDPLPLEKVPSTLGAAWHLWEQHRQTASRGNDHSRIHAIAIAREAGVPDDKVAEELERRLGWPAFNHELIDIIARRLGLSSRQVETIDEKHGGWLAETFEAMLSMPTVRENIYVCQLMETMLDLAEKGECILVGRGGAHFLPQDTTFRVRLVAPLRDRIEHLRQTMGLSFPDAKRRIDETDQRRNDFVKSHFQKDQRDPQNYDLVVNCSRFSPGDCADLILDAMHRLESHRATGAMEIAH